MSQFIFRACSHIGTVIRHKQIVFNLSLKAGIPIQGLIHDISKFSLSELCESIKYYKDGKQSPLVNCKIANGYSNAWQHHIRYNKHHLEYWINASTQYGANIIPYTFWVELVCDNLAAGINYLKEDWTNDYQLNYWVKKIHNWKKTEGHYIHPAIENSTTEVLFEVSKYGINKVITKKNLRRIYEKNVKFYV